MNRRAFCKAVGLGSVAASMPGWVRAAIDTATALKTNVILILSDDVGLGNIGCYGGAFKTPNIDALAKDGIQFQRCYSTPLCGPSRCQLLTGQYPFRTGLVNNQSAEQIDPKKQVMIPTVLKQAGYATAHAGKWGQMALGPGEWGFDEYLVYQGSGKYWASQDDRYVVNGKPQKLADDVYLPDVMHDFVIDFATRHRDKPFFVHYSMSHMHGKILRTPDSKPGDDLYVANAEYMDKLVGKLQAELKRLDLLEKTLVIFVGDNGTAGNLAQAPVNGKQLSGAKGSMWEGGARVPLIAHWPGTIKPGQVVEDLVDFSDFLPTLAEIAGAKPPADRTIDGVSFAGRLNGKPAAGRSWVYVELNGRRYVCTARWKLTGSGELYDMKDAPFVETLVPADSTAADVVAARKELGTVLDELLGKERGPDANGMDKPAKPANRPRRAKPGKAG